MESEAATATAEPAGHNGFWGRRPWLAAALAAAGALVACAFVARLDPPPHPRSYRDFSTLLLVDTFRHGRLANPAPAYAAAIQSPEVLIAPRYISAQPPLQGVFPLIGVWLGNPYYGSALGFAAACAALVWMLRAWATPGFALLAGLSVALQAHLAEQLGLSLGPASPLLLGGALVLGALPRLGAPGGAVAGAALGMGALLLATLDPLSAAAMIPVAGLALVFARRRWRGPAAAGLATAGAVLALGLGWHAYYNLATTGSPGISPARLYAERHGVAPELLIQSFDSERSYDRPSQVFQDAYGERGVESKTYFARQSWDGFTRGLERKLVGHWNLLLGLSGSALCLLALRRWRDPALRLALAGGLVFLIEVGLRSRDDPAHLSAAVPLFALGVASALAVLSELRARGLRIGVLLAAYVLPVVMAEHVESLQNERLWADGSPLSTRPDIERSVLEASDRALVLAAYRPGYPAEHEWVYNGADPDSSPILWARDGTPEENQRLADMLPDRQPFLAGSQNGYISLERHPKRVDWWFAREARSNPKLLELSRDEKRALGRWYRSEFESGGRETDREKALARISRRVKRGQIAQLKGLEGDALHQGIQQLAEKRVTDRRARQKQRIENSRIGTRADSLLKEMEADPAQAAELAALTEVERKKRAWERARVELAEQRQREEGRQSELLARALAVYQGTATP